MSLKNVIGMDGSSITGWREGKSYELSLLFLVHLDVHKLHSSHPLQ